MPKPESVREDVELLDLNAVPHGRFEQSAGMAESLGGKTGKRVKPWEERLETGFTQPPRAW